MTRRRRASLRRATRLDSFIRRLEAQRATLDRAARMVAGRPGIVLELGLGNGRTFDHLRKRLAVGRAIYAFDRRLAAHPACVPASGRLVLGEFRSTLPRFIRRHGARAVLVHADIGSGDRRATAALARWLGPALSAALARDAVVVSDQALRIPGCVALPLPSGVRPGRYFMYRRVGEADRPPPARGRRGSASRAPRAARKPRRDGA